MSKFKIAVEKTIDIDIGQVPEGFIRDMLENGGDGYMMGKTDWSLGDFDYDETVQSVTVEVIKK